MDLPNLPIKQLNSLAVNCSSTGDLLVQSIEYQNSVLIVACASNKLHELVPILSQMSFDTLYILNLEETVNGSVEPWWNKTTIVQNENELMRHLCAKSTLCCYNEGMEHRKNGDFGLANACFIDSIGAVDYSAKFI